MQRWLQMILGVLSHSSESGGSLKQLSVVSSPRFNHVNWHLTNGPLSFKSVILCTGWHIPYSSQITFNWCGHFSSLRHNSFKTLFYLFERPREKDFPLLATVRTGPSWSQEPGTQSDSPGGWQVLSSLPFLPGSGVKMQSRDLKPDTVRWLIATISRVPCMLIFHVLLKNDLTW